VSPRRREVCAALLAAFAGCTGTTDPGGSDPEESADGTDADGTDAGSPSTSADSTPADETADESPGLPAYATCDGASNALPASAPAVPESLEPSAVASYVEAVERTLVLPPDDEIVDGHVIVGTVETESVEHGVLARVPVNGGYYNEPMEGNTTATVHADLGTHVGNYFVGERVVRRVRDRDGESDPREDGRVLVCRPE